MGGADRAAAAADPRIIVALDEAELGACRRLLAQLSPELCRVKVGKELFCALGPDVLHLLANQGFEVFLDLKFHDIPSTVAAAVRAAARHGVWMINVHTLGGPAMLAAAREAAGSGAGCPLLIGVTVLTSLDEQQLHAVGIDRPPLEQAALLAQLAAAAGLDGVVCSAQEAAALRRHAPPGFVIVTPGIRPAGDGPAQTGAAPAAPDDQHRIMTPAAAIAAGADYLVIGRPITRSSRPRAQLAAIHHEVCNALTRSKSCS